MPESVSTRAAAVVGVAGFGLAAVLAGAVFAVGGSASAAATCAATNPTESPTEEPSATDSPSAEPSDSGSPVPSSTTNSNGSIVQAVTDLLPLGNGQGTTTGSPEPTSTDSAEPTASATPTANTTVTLAPRRVVKGDPVRITGSGLPGCHVQVLGYSRPNTTYKVVRNGTIADNGKFSFTVYPPSNTRVYARSQGASDSKSTTVNVRFVVSLKVTRVGVKTYRFEGGVGPGTTGVHVTIWRAVKGSNPVKVGTVDTASNGVYSLVHQFSGTGTFTFYAVAGTTANNDSNRSALVQANIH